MQIGIRAGHRTLGVYLMVITGATAMGAMAAAAQDAATVSTNSGATHDIVMRLSVPVSCRMTASAAQIHLTGTADDGATIDTTLAGQGGLVVDCNTPYAMTLARTPVYAAPKRVMAVESVLRPEDEVAAPADGMTVLVRVAGLGRELESNCVMARAAETPFVCHAFAGPDDARLPPPRAAASLIVTGAVERAGDSSAVGNDDDAADAGVETLAALSDAQRAAMRTGDDKESAVVRYARDRVIGRHIGDRLTVSLSARY